MIRKFFCFATMAAAVLLLAGCDAQNPALLPVGTTGAATPEKSASVQGVAQLAEAAADGHAGVLVYLAGTGFQARTDTDGSYRITGVPRGEYNVRAERAGYQNLTIDRITLDPERHTPEAPAVVRTAILERAGGDLDSSTTGPAVKALGSIVGEVFLEGEDDADGVRVQADGTMHVTVSDRDGGYRLLNIEPGRYTVTFSHPGFRSFSTEVTVQRGATARVEAAALERMAPAAPRPVTAAGPNPADAVATTPLLREELTGTRSVTGLVEIIGPDGLPETDYARVSVAIDNSDLVVTPNAQGTFRIMNLPPGMYRITAGIDGVATTMQSQLADVTTQEVAQVSFRFGIAAADEGTTGVGRVVGQIILAAPPSPEGGAQIPAPVSAGGVNVGLGGTQNVVMSLPDGRFALENAPTGTHVLIASMDGYETLEVPGIQVVAGATVDLGELVMEPRRDLPRVISTVPEQGARNIMVREELAIVIRFNKPMNRESVLRSIRVTPDSNFTPFIGRGSHPQAGDDALVIVLSNAEAARPIRYNTNYRVSILSTAADLAGQTMQEEFTLNLSMGGVGVASTYPPDGSVGFTVDGAQFPVQIVFNGPVNPATLNNSTIRMRPNHGIVYRVETFVNPVNGFTSAQILTTYQPDTPYTITVSNRVRAANGQPLTNTPFTFRFRSSEQLLIPVPNPVIR